MTHLIAISDVWCWRSVLAEKRLSLRQSSFRFSRCCCCARSLHRFDSPIIMSSVAAARATQDVTAKGKHEVSSGQTYRGAAARRAAVRSPADARLHSALSASPSPDHSSARKHSGSAESSAHTARRSRGTKRRSDECRDGCRAIGCSRSSVQASLAAAERLTWLCCRVFV